MKFLLTLALATASMMSFAADISYEQLVGKYHITSSSPLTMMGDGVSIEYIATIGADKSVELVENIVQHSEGQDPVILSSYDCAGTTSISEENKLVSDVACTGGPTYTQEVDLNSLTGDVDKDFTADVFSTLYQMSINMNFKRLEE